jgi:serine/threonine protein kinase
MTCYLIANCDTPLLSHLQSIEPIDASDFFRFTQTLCNTLQAVHSQGISHGAISEQSLFVTPQGHCYIGQFGWQSTLDSPSNFKFNNDKNADVLALLKSFQLFTLTPSFNQLTLTQQHIIKLISRGTFDEEPTYKLKLPDVMALLNRGHDNDLATNLSEAAIKNLHFGLNLRYHHMVRTRLTDPLQAARQFATALKQGDIVIEFGTGNRADKGYHFKSAVVDGIAPTSKKLPFSVLRGSENL